jgi:hypothetical protein
MGRSKGRDSADDTFGVRGAGATWQADFGMPLNEADLLFAVRREPIGKRNVFTVAHDIFDKFFKVEEVAEKPNPEWSREVSKVLDDLNAKAVLTQMTVFERLFGWAIIALTYVDRGKDVAMPLQDPKEIRQLVPYSSLQFTVQASDEDKNVESDRFGLPILYTVRRSGVSQAKLHYSRVIHCATQLLDHPYKGMSALECIYDDLTVWRNERWGFGQTITRYGSGFPDVTIAGASKKDIDDFAESHQFKTLHSKSYFVHDETKTLEFKGLAGRALDPEPYATPVLESLSCGTGIPLALLRGAQAGALTGSEVNEREYFKFISGLQTLLEPVIWELIDRLMETGQISRVNDYRIVWLSGIELSEKDKAAVDLSRAQERNLKSGWMTVDEIRAEQGLAALPKGEGNVVLGVKKASGQQQVPGQVQAGPGQVSGMNSQADMNVFEKFVSWLRGKKDANDKDE